MMNIDAHFVKDILLGARVNSFQVVAHVGLADGCHYFLHIVMTKEWEKLTPDNAHAEAHRVFNMFDDDFHKTTRHMFSQVYCRAFMHAVAYLVGAMPDDSEPDLSFVAEMVEKRKFELHFAGLEDTATGGTAEVKV